MKTEIRIHGILEKVEGLINLPEWLVLREFYMNLTLISIGKSMIEHLYITKTSELIPALEAVAQGDNYRYAMDNILSFSSAHSG